MLDKIYKPFIEDVYNKDLDKQKEYIEFVINTTRNMSTDIIYKAQGIFIPDNDYMLTYMGPEALNANYGLYYEDICLWTGQLVFPIKSITGQIVGLVGFDPFKYIKAHEENDWSLNYYSYSTKKVFTKGRYLYLLDGVFEKSIQDGYICITDGYFDTLSLNDAGFHCGSLLGSSPTDEIFAILRLYDHVYLFSDNDEAGLKLEKQFKSRLNNCVSVKQKITKDIDELLKSSYRNKAIEEFHKIIDRGISFDSFIVKS